MYISISALSMIEALIAVVPYSVTLPPHRFFLLKANLNLKTLPRDNNARQKLRLDGRLSMSSIAEEIDILYCGML